MMDWMKMTPKQLKYPWIAIGIVYLLTGSMMFWAGFHNIDYSRNFLMICYRTGVDYDAWGDENLGGNVVNFDEVYSSGLDMAIIGLYTSIAGAAITCYGLSIGGKYTPIFDGSILSIKSK